MINFHVRRHLVKPDAQVVEIWSVGQFIATIATADESGIRVLSKYPLHVVGGPDGLDTGGELVNNVLIRITLPPFLRDRPGCSCKEHG